MLKKLLLGLVLLTTLACSAGGLGTPAPTAVPLETEEEAVYAVLLGGYQASMVVITNATVAGIGRTEDMDRQLDYLRENMTGLSSEVTRNFTVRNDQSYPLRADMDLGVPYVLLDTPELNEIFGGSQDGWEVFYSRYPEAPGIITLSRVGFNARMDQALVYIGNQSHWLAGAGYYVLLEKQNGTWTVDQQVMAWIS